MWIIPFANLTEATATTHLSFVGAKRHSLAFDLTVVCHARVRYQLGAYLVAGHRPWSSLAAVDDILATISCILSSRLDRPTPFKDWENRLDPRGTGEESPGGRRETAQHHLLPGR